MRAFKFSSIVINCGEKMVFAYLENVTRNFHKILGGILQHDTINKRKYLRARTIY